MESKRVLSGLQTSGNGELHIGNYLGAVRQWIALQESSEAYYMLANLHAVTVPLPPATAKENVYKMAALVLALGLDPNKATLFVQSQVPAHSELAWLLNTIASYGELQRMTQFKDKAGGDQEGVSVGLFDYPILMAADILLYQADEVPVGEDQKQHLELTRNLAERFNGRYGQTFKLPQPYLPAEAARIMGLDNPTKKMSKSLGPANYLGLLDDTPKIREKLQRAVTDSDNEVRFDKENKPGISNLLTIYAAMTGRSIDELTTEFAGEGYGRFKASLSHVISQFLTPVQKRYYELMADRPALDKVLAYGAAKANAVADQTLQQVKERMGLV